MMYELRIFDKSEKQDYIISLGELIKVIEKTDYTLIQGLWIIQKGAYGYGKLICSIEDELKRNKYYLIKGSKLFPVLKSDKEYFHNVNIKKNDSSVAIGIIDSSYLFFQSENEELINCVKKDFEITKVVCSM